MQGMTSSPASHRGRVLLAKPRGYCAGVDRAVQTVEHALDHYGAPVYVRKQIVHNLHVVHITASQTTFVELFASLALYPAIRELGVKIDSRTLELGPVPLAPTPIAHDYLVSNSFAFGGLNAVLIGRRA